MERERPSEVPIAGSVTAGFPSPEEEALRDIISIDQFLCVRPGQSFLLEVTGDSMSGAGIIEGDLVVVEKGRTPKNGDIVVAAGGWGLDHEVFHPPRPERHPGGRQPEVPRDQSQDRAASLL